MQSLFQKHKILFIILCFILFYILLINTNNSYATTYSFSDYYYIDSYEYETSSMSSTYEEGTTYYISDYPFDTDSYDYMLFSAIYTSSSTSASGSTRYTYFVTWDNSVENPYFLVIYYDSIYFQLLLCDGSDDNFVPTTTYRIKTSSLGTSSILPTDTDEWSTFTSDSYITSSTTIYNASSFYLYYTDTNLYYHNGTERVNFLFRCVGVAFGDNNVIVSDSSDDTSSSSSSDSSSWLSSIVDWLSSIFDTLGTLATTIVNGIGDFLNTIIDWLISLYDTLSGLASSIIDGLTGFLTAIVESLGNMLDFFSTLIVNIASAISDVLTTVFSALFDFISWFLTDFIPDLVLAIVEGLTGFLTAIVESLGNILEFFGTLIVNLASAISDVIVAIFETTIDVIATIADYLNPFSDNFIGTTIVEGIGDILTTVLKALFVPDDDYFSSHFEDLQDELNDVFPFYDYLALLEDTEDTDSTDISTSVSISGLSIFGYEVTGSDYIDLSIFNNYKETWYTWCRVVIYILLILYNVNEIIKFLRGFSIYNGSGKTAEPVSTSVITGETIDRGNK